MASLERNRVPSPRPIAVREVPLVDRVEEMEVLKETVYKAVHGEGGLVFVYGEAGIGKTRLLREVGAYARSRGVQVLYGRCPALFRMDGVPPYIIWKEVIKDYLETCTLEHLDRVIGYYPAEVAKLVPEIGQRLRTIPQSFQISPEQEQNRLFEAVSQFITNISRESPLLVILDDLQWTDPSSLLLLHYLARGVQKTPLLLLGAYRSTDVDDKHPLTAVLTELNRERLPQEIMLNRMSLSDISEMIRGILEQEDVPEEFCKLVYDKTRGNPFFAEEVVKSLKEEGAIYREESVWKFKEVSAIEFPKSVKNVIKARINRLDAECQSVLTMASFIGNDFTLEAISALTGIEENRLLELTDRLLKTGLIKEREVRGEGVCSFADILVRDVVYEEVSLLKRKKLHSVVGCALEKVYAKTLDEHSGELASHFLESGDKDKALGYFLKAGEKARKVYANTEEASYLQSALKLLEEKEEKLQERGRVLEWLGDVKKLVGQYEPCMKYWTEALQLYDQLGEKLHAARGHRKIASVFWEDMGDAEKAKVHHEKALKILEAEPETNELASLYEDMARMYGRTESMTKALFWAQKAVDLAEKLSDCAVMASSYISLGEFTLHTSGNWKKTIEIEEKALKIALDNGLVETAIGAYNGLATAIPWKEQETCISYFEKGFELAKKVGNVRWVSRLGATLANLYSEMGMIDKAVLLAEESVALDRKTGNMPRLSSSLGVLANVNLVLGEWDKSEHYRVEQLDLSRKLGQYERIAWSSINLGFVYFIKGDLSRARELLEGTVGILEKGGATLSQMLASISVVLIYIEAGMLQEAHELINTVRKFFVEMKEEGWIGWAEVLRGMELRALKKWEESIEYFEKGRQMFEQMNCRRWMAYSYGRFFLCEYARVYLERDEKGDREKAHTFLDQALEIFQKMGAKKDIERVEAQIAFIETGKEVSKAEPSKRVSTGIADLDKLLYGGIPSNYAVVLTSPSCDEKDLVIKSFLEGGAKKGEVTFYVTIDPGIVKGLYEEPLSSFYLFVCNPEADAIVRDASNVVKLKGVENLTDISIGLTSTVRKLDPSSKGPKRICISLVSDVLLQHHAVETRRWLTALLTKMKSEGFTTLAVMDSRIHPSEELYAIVGLFDGEISIFERETEKGRGRYLKIQKMSNQEYLESELPLKKADLKDRR